MTQTMRAMQSRVTMHVDPTLDASAAPLTQSRVRVRLRNGRVVTADANGARGYPDRPASDEDLEAKFMSCAASPLTQERAGAALGALRDIEAQPDVRPLILLLQLKEDNPVAIEVARARGVAFRAALDEIEGDPSEEAELLRLEYRAALMQAEANPDGAVAAAELPADPLRRRAIAAARRALLTLRESEDIGDDAFHQLEEELDRAELGAHG